MILGIDALNLSELGGFNHIVKILSFPDIIRKNGISKIVLWANANLANVVESNELIEVIIIEKNDLISRTFYQTFQLSKIARMKKCDAIFSPGGAYTSSFKPYITMFQNMLSFDKKSSALEGISLLRFKFFLLHFLQKYSFKNSNGLIFLSDYAYDFLHKNYFSVVSQPKKTIIPIGVDKFDFDINDFNYRENNDQEPLRILYVSTVRNYKHQWNLIYAFIDVIKKGYNIELHLVGGGVKSAINKMKKAINKADIFKDKIYYHENIEHDKIAEYYRNSDIFAYPSSCENLPAIILEAMSFGLPIISANVRPMTDILGNSALYFNHENIDSISSCIEKIINSKSLREKMSFKVYNLSKKYSWEKCAHKTFSFINEITNDYQL